MNNGKLEDVIYNNQKPLFNCNVLLVRTSNEESQLAKALKNKGANVIEFPRWEKKALKINEKILMKLQGYKRILFTSPDSVEDFFNIVKDSKVTATFYGASSKSLKKVEKKGHSCLLESSMSKAGDLLIVGDQVVKQKKTQFQEKYGMHDAFQTSEKTIDETNLLKNIKKINESNINTVIFPSAASVDVLTNLLKKTDIYHILDRSLIGCMGPSSWNMVIKYGYEPTFMPKKPTNEELVNSLIKAYTFKE